MEFGEFMETVLGKTEIQEWQKRVAKALLDNDKPYRVIVSFPPTYGRGWFAQAWLAAEERWFPDGKGHDNERH